MKITLECQVSSGEHYLKGLSIADPQARFVYEFKCDSWLSAVDRQTQTLKWKSLNPMPPPSAGALEEAAHSKASPRPLNARPTIPPTMYGEEEEEEESSSSEASTRRSEKIKSPVRALAPVPSPKDGRTSPAPAPLLATKAKAEEPEETHSATLTPSVSASLPPLSSTSASEASESGIRRRLFLE